MEVNSSIQEESTRDSTLIRSKPENQVYQGSDSEESKHEQVEDSLKNSQTEQCSYDDGFLAVDDYTEEEINDYKNSLVHDEDEVHKRLKQIYDKKGMLNVVMVAEKPKIAELISQVLSQNKHK